MLQTQLSEQRVKVAEEERVLVAEEGFCGS